jgi:hypothetical protein
MASPKKGFGRMASSIPPKNRGNIGSSGGFKGYVTPPPPPSKSSRTPENFVEPLSNKINKENNPLIDNQKINSEKELKKQNDISKTKETDIGKFILEQNDIRPTEASSGNLYYHISDVCKLLSKYEKQIIRKFVNQ